MEVNGTRMRFVYVFAQLAPDAKPAQGREDYAAILSFDEIANLTDEQIKELAIAAVEEAEEDTIEEEELMFSTVTQFEHVGDHYEITICFSGAG